MKTNLDRAKSFYMKGGRTGCLLIHGYTDSPFTVESLGKRLAGEGYTVRADLLPGHGTDPAELNRLAWRAWWDTVVAAYDMLARECDQVFVAGLSFGGTLALHLAQHRPVAGLATLSAMLGSVDPRPYSSWWLKHFLKFVPKGIGPDVSVELKDYVGYDTVPVGGVAEVMKLIAHVRDDLSAITCPVLVIHGQHDHTVPLENARLIHDSVSSSRKKLVILPNSFHVVTLDVERDLLETEVLEFVRKNRAPE